MSEEKVKNIKTEEREQEEKQIVYDGTNHKRILSDEEMNKLDAPNSIEEELGELAESEKANELFVVNAKKALLKETHKLVSSGYSIEKLQSMLLDAESPHQRNGNPFLEEVYNLNMAGFSYQDIYSIIQEEVKVNNNQEQIDVLTDGEQMKGKITYYAINENEAQIAHSMKYYYPYEHGTKTKEYREEVDKIYDMVTKISKVRPEAAETAYQLANQFSKEMADNMNQAIKVECMCPSDMIAGAKNISAKMRKQQDTARMKNQKEYREIKKIEKRLDNILTGKEKIQTKTISAIKKSDPKLTEEKESTKQQQQSVEEKNQEQLQQTIEKSGIKQNNKYFKAVENIKLEKLQLMFTGKPNEKMRDILKDNHFHWSWENRAWERALTDEAMKGANTVATKFEELEKQGKLEFEKLESSKPSHAQNKKFHGRKFEERDYDYTSLENQLTLSRDRKYQEKIQGGLEPRLDQSQDKLHQEQLGMVEDVNIEIEIGE